MAIAHSPKLSARLLGDAKPQLLITDPPYGIELDSEWRDRAGLNGHGPAEPSYMKHRTEGHMETTISGDTRADWSEAFELVPSLQVAYVWHASKFTSEVLAGLLRIGFVHHQQIIWDKQRTVLTRTLYWFQHEPCWFVRRRTLPGTERLARIPPSGVPFAEVHLQRVGEGREMGSSHAKANGGDASTDPKPHPSGRDGLRLFPR